MAGVGAARDCYRTQAATLLRRESAFRDRLCPWSGLAAGDRKADITITRPGPAARWECHDCDSRVDRVPVTGGDPRLWAP